MLSFSRSHTHRLAASSPWPRFWPMITWTTSLYLVYSKSFTLVLISSEMILVSVDDVCGLNLTSFPTNLSSTSSIQRWTLPGMNLSLDSGCILYEFSTTVFTQPFMESFIFHVFILLLFHLLSFLLRKNIPISDPPLAGAESPLLGIPLVDSTLVGMRFFFINPASFPCPLAGADCATGIDCEICPTLSSSGDLIDRWELLWPSDEVAILTVKLA